MSSPPEDTLPRADRRRTLLPGLIWAIPLAAVIVVGYLGIRAFSRRGEVVTVTFKRAADAHAGDTKVLYQGVEAGHLIKITPNPDGRQLDFQLRLIPEAKRGLNSNARFWLIGASPTLSDLSSLKAVVSGVAIGYAPGEGGSPMTRFVGLDRAPTVLPGDRGTRYVLNARTLGSIGEGSGLLFHGQAIGKVTEVHFKREAGFALEIFVFQPYDTLIKPGARFWKISPLRLSLAGGGVNANLAPISTLLSGGIDLELTTVEPSAQQAKPESQFTLYASQNAAKQGLSGPTVRYEFAFAGAAGDLSDGAAITLLGFQIGEVESAQLAYDEHTGKPFTTVTASLYPEQLNLTDPALATAGDRRSVTDAQVSKLLKFGYRARLQQQPALVGDQSIALVEVKGVAAAGLDYTGANPRIPSAPGATDFGDITSQADQILSKINHVPIEEIGQDLRHITSRLNALVSSPKMDESLAHLNSTLAEVDTMLGQAQPQVGPLLSKLNQAADQIAATATATRHMVASEGGAQGDSLPETIRQLNEAARSVRTLADYLDRHPEALIRGKRPDK